MHVAWVLNINYVHHHLKCLAAYNYHHTVYMVSSGEVLTVNNTIIQGIQQLQNPYKSFKVTDNYANIDHDH